MHIFVITGVYFVIKSNLIVKENKLNYKYLCIGCVFLALAFACRSTTLFISILILPELIKLLITSIKEIKTDKKGIVKFICCCVIPYMLVGLLLMIYNYVRFDNLFNFGTDYKLTVTDIKYMKFSISRIAIGIYSFLFSFPTIILEFPFIFLNNVLPFY